MAKHNLCLGANRNHRNGRHQCRAFLRICSKHQKCPLPARHPHRQPSRRLGHLQRCLRQAHQAVALQRLQSWEVTFQLTIPLRAVLSQVVGHWLNHPRWWQQSKDRLRQRHSRHLLRQGALTLSNCSLRHIATCLHHQTVAGIGGMPRGIHMFILTQLAMLPIQCSQLKATKILRCSKSTTWMHYFSSSTTNKVPTNNTWLPRS
mmetsp:Transcript_114904/g.228705  ORF Transcript_114904/g.228705 Transcript_114904/m.228705 type:complete len:204 (-) Transcript_114904:348-959(-)